MSPEYESAIVDLASAFAYALACRNGVEVGSIGQRHWTRAEWNGYANGLAVAFAIVAGYGPSETHEAALHALDVARPVARPMTLVSS